jgi:hypothetical protein
MNSLRPLGSWVRIPVKTWIFGVCMRLFCVYVVLRLRRGLATSWSLVQGVLPSAKSDYDTESEARVLNGLEEPLRTEQNRRRSIITHWSYAPTRNNYEFMQRLWIRESSCLTSIHPIRIATRIMKKNKECDIFCNWNAPVRTTLVPSFHFNYSCCNIGVSPYNIGIYGDM